MIPIASLFDTMHLGDRTGLPVSKMCLGEVCMLQSAVFVPHLAGNSKPGQLLTDHIFALSYKA